jgi:gamma-glutamylcyclotransferase (GGCT)/AIG2-like uncharacterized protein YtfP
MQPTPSGYERHHGGAWSVTVGLIRTPDTAATVRRQRRRSPVTDADNRWTKGGWRSPAGIGTIAAVAGVLVAVIALFIDREGDKSPGSSDAYMFVYGTTMPGPLRYPAIEDFVAEATRASVPGRLYDSGNGYPAARFGGGSAQGTIEGYLLRLRPDRVSEARRAFTAFEAGLFEPVPVTTDDGVTATAYEWIGSIEGLPRVDGMWNGPEA